MSYYAGAIVAAKVALITGAFAGVAIMATGADVAAQDAGNRIEVMICPGTGGSVMTLTEPKNDSVVSGPKVTVGGSVLYISQIDFFIDNVYNNTLALGNSDVAFDSTLTLSPGTHTLKIVATDSCSQATHTESVVVTYEPAIQPSVGEEVETTVAGEVTNSPDDTTDVAKQSALESFINNIIAPPVISLGKALDVIPQNGEATKSEGENIVRSSAFVVGSAFVFLALYVGVLGALPAKLAFLGLSQSRLVSLATMIGLGVIALVFML